MRNTKIAIWTILSFFCIIDAVHSSSKVKVEFTSKNYSTFREIVTDSGLNNSIKIKGHLFLPKKNEIGFPTVVILHGVSGKSQNDYDIADAMVNIGVAALVFDSNSARKVAGPAEANYAVSDPMRVSDAFGALNFLCKYQGVDSQRIGVIGLSRGGLIATLTASEKLRARLANTNAHFAAHIAVYPVCHVQLKEIDFTGVPMLMMLGEKDNITPAKICIDYSERIKQAGVPIETIIYPGAAHGFTDAKLSGKTVRHKVLADYSKCIDRSVQMNFDGTWFYPFKNQIFEEYVDWNDLTSDCRKNGQGEIGDPSKVRKQFYHDLKTFISALFL